MGPRATIFAAGATLVIALLLLPLAAAPEPLSALLALVPLAAVTFAVARPERTWLTHAAVPLSFLPAAVFRPDLFRAPAQAGLAGLVALAVGLLAFAILLRGAARATAKGPDGASASDGWHPFLAFADTRSLTPSPRGRVARLLAGLATLGPAVALWYPLFTTTPRPLAIAFAAIATLALARGAFTDFPALAVDPTPHDRLGLEAAIRAALRARARQIPLGVALGALTGLAGLAWYLRLGGTP
jgi:hypothetical protein